MKKTLSFLCAVMLAVAGMAQSWAPIHGNGFEADDIYGNHVNVADTLAAGKYIVVDYSATWCPPCFNFHQSGILEAIHEQMGDRVCVLWVESDNSTTLADIQGTGSNTQGNWTVDAQGNPIPYPIIDCASCESMIDPTGYVPAIYFVTPSGYYCHIYGETWGFGIQTPHATAIAQVNALINNAPCPGQPPHISGINFPAIGRINSPINFSVDFISVDDATIAWTFQGGNPGTANTANASCTWSAAGTYNVSVTITNANGTDTKNGTITIKDFAYYFDFENTNDYADWTTIDADGDGQNWTLGYLRGQGAGHDGSNGMLASASYYNQRPLTPDNWIFTGALNIPNNPDVNLAWYEKGQDASYAAEKYAVYVATAPNIESATKIQDFTATGSWTLRSIPLAAYQGQTIYIALRHYNVTDMFWLDIDDMGISNTPTTGISNVNNIAISVYPNPATDKLTVSAEGLREVNIIDLTGRTVATSTSSVVDLTSLSAGTYIVRVVTNEGTANQRFVKE